MRQPEMGIGSWKCPPSPCSEATWGDPTDGLQQVLDETAIGRRAWFLHQPRGVAPEAPSQRVVWNQSGSSSRRCPTDDCLTVAGIENTGSKPTKS
jgi:hypothetical protein